MNIGYDAKRFFNNFTGLGNYSRFIVDAVSRYYPDNHYYLYSPKVKSHPEIDQIVTRDQVHVIKPGAIGSVSFLKSVWRSWGMSMHPTIKSLDIYHGLSHELPIGLPAHIKKVVTVHDLIFMRYPQFYNPIDVRIYKAKVKSACNHADRIVAISQQTKSDLIDFLNIEPSKIDVVYQGCHPIFKQAITQSQVDHVRSKYNLPKEYILNVGTIESRKNAALIVEALAQLPVETQIPLVIVGRETEYKKVIIDTALRYKITDKIIFIHNANFLDLPALYKAALVFIYPSLFEGFGIPLVEAIESSVPVITSQGSCFSEAAGPDALYVDSANSHELMLAIQRVVSNETLRKSMIEAGKRYISRFEPAQIASDLFKSYQRCI